MGGSKLLARMLLLISSVTLISLLALTRCGLGGTLDNGIMDDDSSAKNPLPKTDDHHMILMKQREEENQHQILKLKAEIKNLKLELFQIKSENLPNLLKFQTTYSYFHSQTIHK